MYNFQFKCRCNYSCRSKPHASMISRLQIDNIRFTESILNFHFLAQLYQFNLPGMKLAVVRELRSEMTKVNSTII